MFPFLKYSVALSKMLLQSRVLSMSDISMKAIAHYYDMFFVAQLLSLEYILQLSISACVIVAAFGRKAALFTEKSKKFHSLYVLNCIL